MTGIFASLWPSRQRSSRNQPARRNRLRTRFALELLEDRSVPSSATLAWSAALGDTTAPAWSNGIAVATDAAGDVFAVGNYSGGFAAPASSTVLFSSQSGGNGVYLAKYSQSGAFEWAVNVSGSVKYAEAFGVAVNSAGTSVYVVGSTGAAVSSSVNPYVEAGFNGIYYSGTSASVWALNGATGSQTWATSINGASAATSVAVDGSGDVYVASLYSYSPNTISSGSSYVTMFNPSSPSPVSQAAFSAELIESIATATLNGTVNVYVGAMGGGGTVTIGSASTNLTGGTVNGFLEHYSDVYTSIVDLTVKSSTLTFGWDRVFVSVDNNADIGIPWDCFIATDSAGDVYVTGNFVGQMNFSGSTSGSGPGYLNGTDFSGTVEGAVYIVKLSTSVAPSGSVSGVFDWAEDVAVPTAAMPYTVAVTGIAADSSGVYLTGGRLAAGSISFNPLDPAGTNSADVFAKSGTFVAKLNASGAYQWVVPFQNPENYTAIAVDSAGDIDITGTCDGGPNYLGTPTASVYQWTQS